MTAIIFKERAEASATKDVRYVTMVGRRLNRSRSPLLLMLAMIWINQCPGTGVTAETVSKTEGESLIYNFTLDSERPLTYVYFQKMIKTERVFINGYHALKQQEMLKLVDKEYRRRTNVNHTAGTVEMSGLTLTDSGDYMVEILYNDPAQPNKSNDEKINFHLKVTGKSPAERSTGKSSADPSAPVNWILILPMLSGVFFIMRGC